MYLPVALVTLQGRYTIEHTFFTTWTNRPVPEIQDTSPEVSRNRDMHGERQRVSEEPLRSLTLTPVGELMIARSAVAVRKRDFVKCSESWEFTGTTGETW